MINIVNGNNRFKKEFEIKNIITSLGPSYSIQEVILESNDKQDIVREKLESIFINLSRNDASLFCGVILLPQTKKKDDSLNLMKDILSSISQKCGEDKQLIIYIPLELSEKQKKDISSICGNRNHKFIDLTYISSKSEILDFTQSLINQFNIQFESTELQEETIDILLSSFHFILDKNKELKRPTIFSSDSKKVYDQFFIYTTIQSFYLLSSGEVNKKINRNDINNLITALNLKRPATSLLSQIFNCCNKDDLIKEINDIFDNLEREDIPSFLGFLKNSLFEYLEYLSNNTLTKRSSIIANGNLKLSSPQKLYLEICELSSNKFLEVDSYKNDLILYFWKQLI